MPTRLSRHHSSAAIPLGSLTQRDSRHGAACVNCASPRVTRLSITLTDGTPVLFTSCHVCDHRVWEAEGLELTREHVLSRTQRTAS